MSLSTATNSNLSKYVFIILFLVACSEKGSKSDDFDINKPRSGTRTSGDKASTRVDLTNKGVGPITSVTLDESVDSELANSGKVIFELKCLVCHKVEENFIGPALKGVIKRRSPEWIMNMILNPEGMLQEDPLAKDLFMEFKGAPMSNMGLTKEEARAVLEYFRTL